MTHFLHYPLAESPPSPQSLEGTVGSSEWPGSPLRPRLTHQGNQCDPWEASHSLRPWVSNCHFHFPEVWLPLFLGDFWLFTIYPSFLWGNLSGFLLLSTKQALSGPACSWECCKKEARWRGWPPRPSAPPLSQHGLVSSCGLECREVTLCEFWPKSFFNPLELGAFEERSMATSPVYIICRT